MLMWEKERNKKMTVNYHDFAQWRVELKGVLNKNANIFFSSIHHAHHTPLWLKRKEKGEKRRKGEGERIRGEKKRKGEKGEGKKGKGRRERRKKVEGRKRRREEEEKG